MALQNIKPTRMELLKLKRRIKLAEKGHKLLKEKRDALFNEFFSGLKIAQQVRAELKKELTEAARNYAVSQANLGGLAMQSFALDSARNSILELDLGERNVMGVRVPTFETTKVKRSLNERGYSLIDSSANVDEAARSFEESLEKTVKLAEQENALMRLGFEIEKTKRKVNALEYNIIPAMQKTKRYIRFRLEERERENFFVLKKVKKKMALKEEKKRKQKEKKN
jgi:V/A-type H+-transporting ATPase subunit D